jgi:uncharacterized membrane protein
MHRDVAVTVLVLVTLIAVLAAVQPILPSNSERFSDLGVLGPNMAIGGYPTNVAQGAVVHLYVYVGNHERAVAYYQVVVKLGNSTTQVSNSTAADAPEIWSYSLILADNKSSTFPVALSMGTAGTNLRLIFELWSYNISSSQFTYTGLWDQLWINVTGP